MPELFTCAAALFDLDGTLVDSTSVVEGMWAEWAAQRGLDLERILAVSHGRRTIETMREIAPHLDVATLEEDAACHAREEETRFDGIIAVDGAHALLHSIPQERWAIVTSCPRRLAERRLTAVGLPIPRVMVTAESVSQGKPDPEGYLMAARLLNLTPEDCIVFEDAPAGLESGRRAGMKRVAVATTFAPETLAADLVVRNLAGFRSEVRNGMLELSHS